MAGQVVECVACGHVGATSGKVSALIFIILLFVFFPAAIVYYIVAKNNKGCSACKSSNVKLYIPRAKAPQSQPQTQQNNAQIVANTFDMTLENVNIVARWLNNTPKHLRVLF